VARARPRRRAEGLLYAVNLEYAGKDAKLADGGRGRAHPSCLGRRRSCSRDQPIDPGRVVEQVADEAAGGIATFIGTTRAHSRGRTVHYLEYEGYAGIGREGHGRTGRGLKARYELCEVAIAHRTGRVDIGGISVVIAVSAPHRQDALAACKDAIDRLKEIVPLWKKEVYEGGEKWIGRGS
jgi:molybdopterin synthase catalytic subunit